MQIQGDPIFERNSASFFSPRRLYWVKTIGQYSVFQVGVQAFAAASGILLIRALTQSQYACFTIANSMQAAVVVLSDGGVAMGLTSIGGRVWQDHHRLGQLIRTALLLQRTLAVSVSVIIIPLLLWMLKHHGYPTPYTVWIALAVLLTLAFQLSSSVLGVVPRLHSQIKRLQNLDFGVALFRFLLIFLACRLFINALLAVFIAAATMGVQYAVLRRWVSEDIETHADVNPEDKQAIVHIIKHQSPNAIFYCLQGQLTIWLISLFGTTRSIAEVGALSRLAIIYSIIGAVMSGIILPSFSRCQSRRVLNIRYLQIVSAFVLFGLCVLGLTGLFPRQCLWILGKNYSHLSRELFLMAISTILTSVAGAMWAMNAAKAWIKNCWIEIPLRLSIQVIVLFFVNLATVRGVIIFGIWSNISPFIVNLYLTYQGLWKHGCSETATESLPSVSGRPDVQAA